MSDSTVTCGDDSEITAGVLACNPYVTGLELGLGGMQATVGLQGVRGRAVDVLVDGERLSGVQGVRLKRTPTGDEGEMRVRRRPGSTWGRSYPDPVQLSIVIRDPDTDEVRVTLRPLRVRLGPIVWDDDDDRNGTIPLLAVLLATSDCPAQHA